MADESIPEVSPAVTHKVCSACHVAKNPEDFYRNRAAPGGLKHLCKACDKIRAAAWYQSTDKKKHSERGLKWRQANPTASKAIFLKSARKRRSQNGEHVKAVKDIWYAANREIILAKKRAYHAANPAPHNERKRKWRAANPDLAKAQMHRRRSRALNLPGTFSASDIRHLMNLQKRRCAHAWCKVSLGKSYHIDHIKPLAIGGSNDRKNLQLLCVPCNLAKGAKHPVDFALRHGMLV